MSTTPSSPSGSSSGAVIEAEVKTSHEESLGEKWQNYRSRLRGGEMGSLPALIGLILLVVLFSLLRPTFFTPLNFANFFTQAAPVVIIAMALVFVLLLGEIDLSAGVTSGVAGALLAVLMARNGFEWWQAGLVAMAAGAGIGLSIGFLVARVGIPSFIVTLACFLAFQGLVLVIIGEGGNVRVTNNVILSIENGNMALWLGWALLVLLVAGYFLAAFYGRVRRIREGYAASSVATILFKTALVAVFGGITVYILNLERSTNPQLISLRGVPIIVPILLVMLIVGTFVLSQTRFGRHMYAVGGNAEAARRAGIRVNQVRIAAFAICSSVAAFGGIVAASRAASVDPNAGRFIVLNAVAAAVIGGTSLFGGRGRLIDAVIGGFVVAVIDNGMGLLGYSAGTKLMITGSVLMLAAAADALSRKRRLVST